MVDLTDEEFEAARERGLESFVREPHAKAARYDRTSGMIIVDLYNGCTFAVPGRQLQGLEDASDDELAEVEVVGWGYGLHWETCDADLTVPDMLAGSFGTARYMEKHRARLRAIAEELDGRRDAIAAE
jgi:hypothetical protein